MYLHTAPQACPDCGQLESYRIRSALKLTSWRPRIYAVAIGGIIVLAAALRLLHLGSKSLWVDECASLDFAQQPWADFWKTMWNGEANMVTYYLLLRGWLHFGSSEFAVRALSVLPAVATVGVVYVLGKRLFSRGVGLLSSLLLTLNACHVAYSQEARSYALLLLLCALSILTFVVAIERPTSANWLLYIFVTVAAIYTHFFAGLVMLAQWVSLVFLPRQFLNFRRLCASALLIALCIAPAMWFMLRKDAGQIDFIPNPGLLELYRLLLFLTSYGGKAAGLLLAVFYMACLGAALHLALLTWRKSGYSFEGWHLALLLSCAFVPIVLDVGISNSGKQIFYYRYLLICLPALVVLAARGFDALRSHRLPAAVLAIVSVLCLATISRYYAKPKENWREATRYLLSNTRPNNTLIFYPWYAQQPVYYYASQLYPTGHVPRMVAAQFYSSDVPRANRAPAIWLLSCREDTYLRSFRQTLLQAYPYHHEWQYDGVIVEEYSSLELTALTAPRPSPATLRFH